MRALTTLIMTVQAFHMQKPGSYAVLLDFGAISMLASDAGGNSAIARFGCSAARSWPFPPPPPLLGAPSLTSPLAIQSKTPNTPLYHSKVQHTVNLNFVHCNW